MHTGIDHTLLDPKQIKPSKPGYESLYEQLEFGRFNSVKSGAAPTLYQELVASQGQRRFTLPQGTFTVGDHSLMVLVNGQMMRVGPDNDYVEIDSRTIEFNFDLDQDDVVVFRVNGGTSGPLMHESYEATAGQTVFDLASSYAVGNHSLLVFVNGAFQTVDIDYEETSPKRVTFLEPLEEGDLVTFRVEGLPVVVSKYPNQTVISTFDNDGRIIREEITGDVHIVKEFEYDQGGFPSRMIIREGGYTVTKTYTWVNGVCTGIEQSVKEAT